MAPASRPLVLTVLFGGRSAEHPISLRSARAVLEHLDSARYDVRLVGITREGRWLSPAASERLLAELAPGEAGGAPYLPEGTEVVVPILHGPDGEDGTVQGWLELLGVPYVGSGVAGSAVGMDKALTKHVLREAGIPVLPWTELHRADWEADPQAVRAAALERGLPCFVKPTCLGSSVGISRVADAAELDAALSEAFAHGERLIVEPAVDARELEVAVLDGAPPLVSAPGEIVAPRWYDFAAKYETDEAALHVPAPELAPRMAEHLGEWARRAFRALRLAGLARVDFLLDRKTGRPALNEVNTMPGFTDISMFPRLMEHSGVAFPELLDRLVELALERAGVAPHEAPAEAPAVAVGA